MTSSSGEALLCRTDGGHTETCITGKQENLAARLDQVRFTLEAEHYDALIETLLYPPEPGPKLKALLRRRPAWQQ